MALVSSKIMTAFCHFTSARSRNYLQSHSFACIYFILRELHLQNLLIIRLIVNFLSYPVATFTSSPLTCRTYASFSLKKGINWVWKFILTICLSPFHFFSYNSTKISPSKTFFYEIFVQQSRGISGWSYVDPVEILT